MNLFKRILQARQLKRDVAEEIESHIEEKIAELEEAGVPTDVARAQARRAFGNVALVKEESRELWSWAPLERLVQDLRYTGRTLRNSPGFAITTVLLLALGIGGNTAIFTVVNTVLLKMLPVQNPGQLVLLGVENPRTGVPGFGMAYPAYELFNDQNRVFSSMLAYSESSLAVRVKDAIEPVNGVLVSGSYFGTLGVGAELGRTISNVDDSSPVAVVSYAYWERRMGGDAGVLGREIVVNQVPFQIIGVAPRRFFGLQLGGNPEIYVPIRMESRLRPGSVALQEGTMWWVRVMGRLANGVSEEQAKANVNQLFPLFLRATAAKAPPYITQTMKDAFQRQRLVLVSGSKGLSNLRRQFERPLLVLMGVVFLVLLITCANVANLLLARAVIRQREMALRLALGAGPGRIMQQLVTESVVLALLGGSAGLTLAELGKRLLITKLSADLGVSTDGRIFVFTAAISIAAGICFGLAPAWRLRRADIAPSMKKHARLTTGKMLVVVQVSLSVLLLVGAGLFVRTFERLESMDTGFTRIQVLVFSINPGASGYSGGRLTAFYDALTEKLEALPGVQCVSASQYSPISGNDSTTLISEYGTAQNVHEKSYSHRNIVSPGYFRTLGIGVLNGRDFSESDNKSAPKVVIVNETFARNHFGARSPIGKKLGYGTGQVSGPVTIVGVVRDSKYNSLREETLPMVYLPYRQFGDMGAMTFEVRASGAVSGIRQAVDRDIAVTGMTTLREQVDQSLAQERILATLISFFGLLALTLAAVGLYGVTNYSVARRTNEIGIRMALGAGRSEVLQSVLEEAMKLVLAGLAIGLAAAFGVTRLIRSMLFGVDPTDPLTLMSAGTILVLVACVAAYLPARRASLVDPMVALRHE
jgi:predicted permease